MTLPYGAGGGKPERSLDERLGTAGRGEVISTRLYIPLVVLRTKQNGGVVDGGANDVAARDY